MYKLTLCHLLFLILLTSAKITKNQFKSFREDNKTLKDSHQKFNQNNTIWVLSLNNDDLNFQRLFKANQHEEKVFKRTIAPSIKNYLLQNPGREEDTIPDFCEIEIPIKNKPKDSKNIKYEISTTINKFLLMQLNDPEMYFTKELKEPLLKVYFIGPYTSLIMTSRRKRYHYFVNPPSPLPRWFYVNHISRDECVSYVEIPKNVQQEFLEKLLNLLKTTLSFPV